MKIGILLLLAVNSVVGLPPPHPAVIAVRHEEEFLPSNLRSPALHNPHLQQILPLTSLLHKGENLVYDRQSDYIPRNEIYKILTHAGFVPRGHRHESSPFSSPEGAHHPTRPEFPEYLLFSNPDLLQHLRNSI